MATESPIRFSETSGKWPSQKEVVTFAPLSSANIPGEELGLLQRGHRLRGSVNDVVPNRSGSAPPSMEGSYLAIRNLVTQKNASLNPSFLNLNSAIEKCQSEEQLRADPAYLAYYCSNINLNPRLPPPLISWEDKHLIRHTGRFNDGQALTSMDVNDNHLLNLPRGTLSVHKEESEDDHSPQQSSDILVDRTNGSLSRQDAPPLPSQHNNLSDLIQGDFHCSPSPVYNQSQKLSYGISEQAGYDDSVTSSLHDPSVDTSSAVTMSLVTETGLSLDPDPSTAPSSSSPNLMCTITTPSTPLQKEILKNRSICSKGEVFTGKVSSSDVTGILSEMKGLNISALQNSEKPKIQEQRKRNSMNDSLLYQHHQQQSSPFQVQSQMSSQVATGSYAAAHQFFSPSKFSAEVQPVVQSSGFTPPLYATATAYMTPNPFYSSVQTPGLQASQYGVGGYAYNSSVVPPFVAYPHHGAVPWVFDASLSPNYNQMPGTSAGGNGADMQQLSKLYGQFGFAIQSSFADPFYMQYYQQPFGELGCGISGQYDISAKGGVMGSQNNAVDLHRGSNVASYLEEHKHQYQHVGGMTNLNSGRMGLTSPNYHGNPQNTGIMMQYQSAPVTSPNMPESPVMGPGLPVGRNEMRFATGSGRHMDIYSGWHGQKGFEGINDPKIHNFLEELKSGKGRRFELSDIVGHVVEFSADQHGSRFIQQKLEICSVEEKASVFKEVLPHASKLMTDVFGNYVIQKFFEYGSPEQRKELANQLTGQILILSLQMYGCRVIQKALEVIELEQKAKLVHELDGHVMRCVRDQNGNHVIQKCIESVPTCKIDFIISSFRGQVAALSMHPYGCRVIQRVLEHCTDEQQCHFIVDEILESVCTLAQDQYGNYVTQHVLERGKFHERSKIIDKLCGHIVQLSQHKFASNVVEKCLEYGGPSERDVIIEEIVGHNDGNDNLLIMMKDQFANYVVQKILETCSEDQRAALLARVRMHAHALKKYTYGKHIVARFEQLFGEENQATGA